MTCLDTGGLERSGHTTLEKIYEGLKKLTMLQEVFEQKSRNEKRVSVSDNDVINGLDQNKTRYYNRRKYSTCFAKGVIAFNHHEKNNMCPYMVQKLDPMVEDTMGEEIITANV